MTGAGGVLSGGISETRYQITLPTQTSAYFFDGVGGDRLGGGFREGQNTAPHELRTLADFEVPDTGRSEGGMLERNIFGSTLSLGGLLNENIFSDGEADQFLQEMGVQSSRGFGEPASAEANSGASSFESTLSGAASCLHLLHLRVLMLLRPGKI